MRIIITENGQKVIKKLNPSNSTPILFNNINNNQDLKEKENPLIKNCYQMEKRKKFMPNLLSNNSLLFSSSNNIKIIGPKPVKIKKRNIKMPLSFLKKYEIKDEENSSMENIIVQPINILSTLENKNNNKNTKSDIKSRYNTFDESKINNSNLNNVSNISSSIFLPRLKSHYSLKEIIPKKCFDDFDNKLKEKLDSEKYNKNGNNRILRKESSYGNIFKEFDNIKNKEINTKNYKLIEYLLEKKTISKNLLQRINESDEKKLRLLDKLSGKVLEKKESEKIFNKRIKEKIDNKINNDSIELRKMLVQIKNNVIDNIKDAHMNKYTLVKENNKIVYRNIYKKFREKFWKKSNNFARYFHKNQNVTYDEI